MTRYWFMWIWLAWVAVAAAQTSAKPDAPAAQAGAEVVESPEAKRLASLKSLADSLATATAEVDKLRAELKTTTSEERKTELNTRIESERSRIRELRNNFQDIVGGGEAVKYGVVDARAKDLTVGEEVQELVRPVVGELRNATTRPREMEALRRALADWSNRMDNAAAICGRIDHLTKVADDVRVKEELKAARRVWSGRLADAQGQVDTLGMRLAEMERTTPSLWGIVSNLFVAFWRTRGLNLLLGLAVGMSGFFLVRQCYKWFWRMGPLKARDRATLLGRLADVIAMATAVVVGVLGVLLVFYARGDWLLLTVAAILLLGAAWGSKAALPPYFNQLRTILNLGAVREGERVIYQGIPWKVRSLGVFSTFVNPELEGGELRLPVKEVLPLVSREADAREPWFPTGTDDWVLLGDGTYGKVVNQSPERVVVLKLGGSYKTYGATQFLAAAPENLSKGFRVTQVFGIDYRHLEDATSVVLEEFSRALTAAMFREYGREGVRSVQVEFARAASSSLEYLVQVDCAGSVAHRMRQVERSIQRVCVEVCRERGWNIPFNQLTLHRGG